MATSNNNNANKSGGVGFIGLLTILFIGLKLTDHIDWSWWWVLSPIWIPFSIIFGVMGLIGIIWLILKIISSIGVAHRRNKRRKW